MSENLNDASNPQGKEREPKHARPMNPLLSGRLGRLSGIGTSSPYRNAGSAGELVTFLILFALVVSTAVGAATNNFIIGVGTVFLVIVLVLTINLLFNQIVKGIMRSKRKKQL